jgi:hypothetical protein
MKGNTCKPTTLEMLVQKTANATIDKAGPRRMEETCRPLAAEEVALKARNLRVTTAANPKSVSLTQRNHPKARLKPTPKMMNTSQITQQTKDKASVRRMEKIGSLLSSDLLTIVSVMYVMAKREMPSAKVLNEGNSSRVVRLTAMMQVAATARSAVLYEGRKNMEE